LAFVASAWAAVVDHRRPPIDACRLRLSRHAELVAASRGESPRPDGMGPWVEEVMVAPPAGVPASVGL
jgi:hypothetical protein